MSITEDLATILSARYGEDVRQAIYDSISEGYDIAVEAQEVAETSEESAAAYAAAALASEQAAEEYMEQAEEYKDAAFSGTPDGYEALVTKVYSLYEDTEDSIGEVDTVEGLALAHTIYGMSEQDGTPSTSDPVDIESSVANFKCVGKNVLRYPYYNTDSYTSNGLTFTINDDYSITINGTCTADNTRFYLAHTTNLFNISRNYDYIMLDNFNDTDYTYSQARTEMAFYNGTTFQSVIRFTNGGSVAVNLNSDSTLSALDYDRLSIYLYFKSGTTFTDFTVYPRIVLADVSDTTYEPYQYKTITTDLTLQAIEVTSSDDYNLVKDGLYYIADTIDWSEDDGYTLTTRIGTIDSYASETLPSYWMSSMESYADGTTPTEGAAVTYVLDEDDYTTTSLSSAYAQALLGLKTYDEATSIDATEDVAPSIYLEYSKDRTTALSLTAHNMAHINSLKIADLS